MQLSCKAIPLLGLVALAALGLTSDRPAAADVTLGGSYNNQTNDGFDAVAGQSYTVLPTATFDSNGGSGLNVNATTVKIKGGDFSNNGFDGVFASFGSTVTITGGTFNHDFDGVEAFSSTVNITGGDFTNNSKSLNTYGSSITLFGDFPSYGLVPDAGPFNPGSFTGRLQNNTTSQTFTYQELNGGTITLAPAAVPEPSQMAAMGVGFLGLGGLILRTRKKKVFAK